MSYVLNQGLGDIGCLGVDIAKWNNTNKVPLFPDAHNTWVIKVRSKSYSGAELTEEVKSIFEGRWFSSGLSTMYGGPDVGRAEIQSIRVLNVSQPSEIMSMYPAPLTAVWNTSGPQLDWQDKGAEAYVEVRFVYRGSLREMFWPRTVSGYFQASWYCPKDTEFGVYTVYAPSYKDVPAENLCDASGAVFKYATCRKQALDKLKLPDFPGLGGLIPSWVKFLGYGILGYTAYRLARPIIQDVAMLRGKDKS